MIAANVSGNWKTDAVPYAKVVDTWYPTVAYAKKGVVWELVYGVPEGLIIMLQSGAVPAGWTQYSEADSKFLVAAGPTYAAGATGGVTTFEDSSDSSTEGSHNDHSAHSISYAIAGDYYAGDNVSGGSHSHTIGIANYTPKKQNMVLIQADTDLPEVPANGMFFGASTLSGFSVFSATNYLYGHASARTSLNAIFDTYGGHGGVHDHGMTVKASNGTYEHAASSSSDHEHTLSIVQTDNFKKAVMRALYKSSAYGLTTGLVGMWEGATAPHKWALCNGSNGTVDLRDSFMLFANTGDGTASGTVAGSVTMTVGLDEEGWNHNHYGIFATQWTVESDFTYLANKYATHSHTHSGLSRASFTPPYLALSFIQYTG